MIDSDGADVASTTKEDLALINEAFDDNEVAEVKVEIPEETEDPTPDVDAEVAEEVLLSFIIKIMIN